jgi:hypothetical protein
MTGRSTRFSTSHQGSSTLRPYRSRPHEESSLSRGYRPSPTFSINPAVFTGRHFRYCLAPGTLPLLMGRSGMVLLGALTQMVLRKSITTLFQATPFSSTVAPSLGSPAPRLNMSPRRIRPRKSSGFDFDASPSSCYLFRPLSSATTPQSNSPSTTTTTRGPNTSTSTFTSSGKSSQMAPSHLSTIPQTTWQLTFSPSHCPNGRSQHMCVRLGYIAL